MQMRAALLVVASLIWMGAPAQAANREAEVRAFVQDFYDWERRTFDLPEHPVDAVLRERAALLVPALREVLEEDARARAAERPGGDIVGLDFDPFVGGQDTCERYDVGEILAYGGAYRVNVYTPCYSPAHEMPDVIVIVVWQGGAWKFENFEYPESGNLLEILKQAAESRAAPAP